MRNKNSATRLVKPRLDPSRRSTKLSEERDLERGSRGMKVDNTNGFKDQREERVGRHNAEANIEPELQAHDSSSVFLRDAATNFLNAIHTQWKDNNESRSHPKEEEQDRRDLQPFAQLKVEDASLLKKEEPEHSEEYIRLWNMSESLRRAQFRSQSCPDSGPKIEPSSDYESPATVIKTEISEDRKGQHDSQPSKQPKTEDFENLLPPKTEEGFEPSEEYIRLWNITESVRRQAETQNKHNQSQDARVITVKAKLGHDPFHKQSFAASTSVNEHRPQVVDPKIEDSRSFPKQEIAGNYYSGSKRVSYPESVSMKRPTVQPYTESARNIAGVKQESTVPTKYDHSRDGSQQGAEHSSNYTRRHSTIDSDTIIKKEQLDRNSRYSLGSDGDRPLNARPLTVKRERDDDNYDSVEQGRSRDDRYFTSSSK
ncbi:hypothetical protein DFH05DRAFT_555460 [Lentinula detonsa]|uniref:Uncharacterized protein n=1 Tax=Lentinula detonsa TaxID=2804962 RepID=A0A9W8P722_9AGAR|nr:hypothetical protein DFH05DRAFT_555460 [Lentinula detonsa]